MSTIITTDAFEATKTDTGIRIKELSNSAKKMGILVTVMGIVMLAISFIPLRGLTADILVDIFTGVFFWGGVVLIPLGILTLVLKGMSAKERIIEINVDTRTMQMPNKSVPFSEIDEFVAESHEVVRKKLAVLFYKSGGKKKAFIAGTFILKDSLALTRFVTQLNELLEEPK